MKKFLLGALVGVPVGMGLVYYELITERLIVNNNLDGSVTLHQKGIFDKKEAK